MSNVESGSLNTLFVSRNGLNFAVDGVQFYLNEIESIARRLNKEFEIAKAGNWWDNQSLLTRSQVEMHSLISAMEKGSADFEKALRLARAVREEPFVSRIFHRMIWGKST